MSYGTDVASRFRQAGVMSGQNSRARSPRPASVAVDQIRVCHQSDSAHNGSHSAGDFARPRRRGDRITTLFAPFAHSRYWHEAAVRKCPLLRRLRGLGGHRSAIFLQTVSFTSFPLSRRVRFALRAERLLGRPAAGGFSFSHLLRPRG
jgi:hypothetical protein